MKKSFWDTRIPTLFAIFLLALAIVPTYYLVQTGIITIGKATPSETPQDVRVSNITDTTFTVSFTTQAETTTSLSFGTTEKGMTNVVLDDRDQPTGRQIARQTHYITVKDVTAATKYFFLITSGSDDYYNNGNPFEITTGPKIEDTPPQQQPASGTISFADTSTAHETIIYVATEGSQTLSTLSKADGGYLIPLNALRTKDLTAYQPLTPDTTITLLLVNALGSSHVTVLASSVNPIPLIIFSQNYDFTQSSQPIATPSGSLGFPFFVAAPSNKNPTIATPKENQTFTDQRPQFRGTAPPGTQVTVTIHSDEAVVSRVTTDQTGNWSFRPEQELSPGQHTITITAPDPFGIMRTIQKSFVVYAQGSQVNESATPSATPTFAPTATPTTPILSPTTTPIPTAMTTSIPTITPTPIILPVTPLPTKAPPLASPGSSDVTIFGLAAFFAAIAGIMTFILSKRTLHI